MEDYRKQAKIEALNKAFPGMTCGDSRCEKLCAEVYDAAKSMRLDPMEAIQKTIERELECDFSCGIVPDSIVLGSKRENNFVRFIAEKSKKTCKRCEQYDGQIFVLPDDRNKMPKLPIHLNCRCKYESVHITKENFKRFLGYLSDATIATLGMVYGPALWGEFTGAIQAGTELMTNKDLIIGCITNALRNSYTQGYLTESEYDQFCNEMERCKADNNIKGTYSLYNKVMRLLKERGVDTARYRIKD